MKIFVLISSLLVIAVSQEVRAAAICPAGQSFLVTTAPFKYSGTNCSGGGAVNVGDRIVDSAQGYNQTCVKPQVISHTCRPGSRQLRQFAATLNGGNVGVSGGNTKQLQIVYAGSGLQEQSCWDNSLQNNNYTSTWRTFGKCEVPPPPPPLPDRPEKNLGDCEDGSTPFRGNPINIANGNKFQEEHDYVNKANPLLSWTRFFNSDSITQPGIFGTKWRSSFDQNLTIGAGPNSTTVATLVRSDGKALTFVKAGSWWIADPDVTYTLQNLASGWRVTAPDNTVEIYDSLGRLTSIQPIGALAVALAYDAQGRLSTVSDVSRTLTVSYDVNNRPSQLQTPSGAIFLYRYDMLGNLQEVTYPDDTPSSSLDNPTRLYHYEDSSFPGNLTGITDENGARFATWLYDGQGRAISSEHSGGAGKVEVAYGSGGSALVTEWRSSAVSSNSSYQFQKIQGAAKVSSVTGSTCQSCGSTAQTTYDSNGFVASKTDLKGNLTTYVRNSRGLETSRTEASGTPLQRSITTQWHPQYRLPTQVDEPGRRTVHQYDAVGRRIHMTIIDTLTNASRSTSFTYNAAGLLATVDGPRSDVVDVTHYSYNASGNLIQVENAAGHLIKIQNYDADGKPGKFIDANGVVTDLAYDARQNLVSRTVNARSTSFDYDATGQVLKITEEDGSFLEYEYDAARRLTDVRDQLGNHIEYTLDMMGNRTAEQVRDPLGVLQRSQDREYNALGLLTADLGGAGQRTDFTYDLNGNPLTESSGGRTSTRTYDALNRVIQHSDFAAGVTGLSYNALDHLIGVNDPRGLATIYSRNAFGDATQLQSPDSGTSSSSYDLSGNLTSHLDAKGQLTAFEYDELNRPTKITYAGASPVIYSYDQGTFGKGRLTGVTDATGTTTWTYDAHGRIVAKEQVTDSKILESSYIYDSAGRLISHTLPSGRLVEMQWVDNHVVSMTLDGVPLLDDVKRNSDGLISAWDFANGRQVRRSFDLSGRMVANSLGAIAYDTDNRIVSITQGSNSALTGTATYTHSDLDRLSSQSIGPGLTYAYDANGNRTLQGTGGGTTSFTIDPSSNRLNVIATGAVTRNLSYDANGSLIADGSHTYEYDSAGRLALLDGSTPSPSEYGYNGFGQRVVKRVNGVSTLFAYDEQGHIQGEYDSAGVPISETIWMGETPVAVLTSNGTYYIQTDHLNTPRQIEDSSGDVVWIWSGDAFGFDAPDEDPLSTGVDFVYNLRLPGQYSDIESGQMYNWHRYYNPAIGRYIQADPTGLYGGSLSTYSYAESSPLKYVDRNGLYPTCVEHVLSSVRNRSERSNTTFLTDVVMIELGFPRADVGPNIQHGVRMPRMPLSLGIALDFIAVEYKYFWVQLISELALIEKLKIFCQETRIDECGREQSYDFQYDKTRTTVLDTEVYDEYLHEVRRVIGSVGSSSTP